MKKLIFSYISLLLVQVIFSQSNDIELPVGNFAGVRNNANNIFQIYVNADETIYIGYNKSKLHEVAKDLNYYQASLSKNHKESNAFDVYLYADKKISYNLIDALKTEIGMALDGLLFYKTGDVNNRESGFNNFMDPVSFHKLEPISLQLPKEEEDKRQQYLKEQDSLWGSIPNPPLPHWLQPHEDLVKGIYSLNEGIINEILSIYPNHNCVVIKNDNIIEYKGQNLNNKELLNILYENDLIFIKAAKDLNYNSYIIFKQTLSDIYKELRQANKKSANSLELSKEIQNLLKRSNINLCE